MIALSIRLKQDMKVTRIQRRKDYLDEIVESFESEDESEIFKLEEVNSQQLFLAKYFDKQVTAAKSSTNEYQSI